MARNLFFGKGAEKRTLNFRSQRSFFNISSCWSPWRSFKRLV